MTEKPENIKPGMELYIPSAGYIDHGEDDRCGGIATVERVIYKEIPQNPYNNWMVEFKDIHSTFNLTHVLQNQDNWEPSYGNRIAHQCPETGTCLDPRKLDPLTEARKYLVLALESIHKDPENSFLKTRLHDLWQAYTERPWGSEDAQLLVNKLKEG